mgnify:FL=1|tara:strand:+ start:609 stop:869 length:261 start_codon:yes stop_codon:yes gene_type:complete
MDIENLIKNIKAKLIKNSFIENVKIEDKTYLHLKHSSHDKNKFHIKLIISSNYLKGINKINATKKIHKILEYEIKNYIHSIQILFD